MDEYIKREAAIERLKKNLYASNPGSFSYLCFQDAINSVQEIPAADVEPVRHGRWENGNPICPVCGGDKFKDLDADIWCDWQPAFCPNCGAKMDGGAD